MIPARRALALILSLVSLGLPIHGVGRAQEASKSPAPYASLEALHASYSQQFAELERRQIADLAALATRKVGPEADAVYRDLFHLVIAHDLLGEADPAAERCLSLTDAPPDVRALATLITVTARTDRGQFDRALDGLRDFLRSRTRSRGPEKLACSPFLGPARIGVSNAVVQSTRASSGRHLPQTELQDGENARSPVRAERREPLRDAAL